MPKYCGECHIQGHLITSCPKGHRETPNIQAPPHSMLHRARPPPDRQNAVKRVSTLLHQPTPLAASSANPHPPPPSKPLSTSAPTPSPSPYAISDRQQPLAAAVLTASTPSPLSYADAACHHPHHSPSHPPSQPSASSLQRPDAAPPSNAPLQGQPSADPLQQSTAATGPSDAHLQAQLSAAPLQQPAAEAEPPEAPEQRPIPLLQRDSAAEMPSAAPSAGNKPAPPPLSPPASPVIPAHASDLLIPTITLSSPTRNPLSSPSSKSHKGKHKSVNFKPSDVGISATLSQQQRAALEQFKSKVLHQTQIRAKELSSPFSVNHFEALRHDHSDADGDDASYYSDTDDGFVEPTDFGYQSANGRSSNKHKDFAPSGMRINKRHPNMPLRVKLRSRKNSCPSTP